MRRNCKKFISMLMAVVMIFAMSATAFAAPNATALTNAKFLRDTGKDLPLGMGDGVISGGTIEGDTIIVNTKAYERLLFTGYIKSAKYVDDSGNGYGSELITVDDNGNGVLILDINEKTSTPTGGVGIYLELSFKMSPFTPPGMKDTMKAYFTCDNLK